MNNYQKHNKEYQDREYIKRAVKEARNGSLVALSEHSRWFRCVACGKENLTSAIMEFFSFDSHRYMCRDCQDANKEPFDHNKFMDDKKSEALNIN